MADQERQRGRHRARRYPVILLSWIVIWLGSVSPRRCRRFSQ
jgi:hypothetical protein